MQRRLFDSPLGHVHYVEDGPADGRPLILMHQTPRSVDEYADVMPLLAEHLRVIAFDNPGYGCSDRPQTQPSIADYATVALALMDHLGLDRATLGGHHTGAIVSVEAAAAWPDRVEGIVLSGPVYMDADSRRELGAIFKQWYVQADGSHLMEKWQRFMAWVSDPQLVHRCLVDLLRAGETSEFGHFAVAEYHMEDRLPRVRAPALVLFGKRDPFGYHDKNRIFADTIAECDTATIDAGVFMPNEAPREWAAAVLRFFER